MSGHGKRLGEGRSLQFHPIRYAVQEVRFEKHVVGESSVGVDSHGPLVLAEVGEAERADLAGPAGSRIVGGHHTVTDPYVPDLLSGVDHHAGKLVPEGERRGGGKPVVVDMYVRAAHPREMHPYQRIPRSGVRHGNVLDPDVSRAAGGLPEGAHTRREIRRVGGAVLTSHGVLAVATSPPIMYSGSARIARSGLA